MSLPEPPSPSGSRVNHFLRFSRDPFELLRAGHQECGELFVLKLPILGRFTCITGPELMRQVYAQPDEVLSAGQLRLRLTGGLLGKSSLFVVDGEAHKYRQSLVIKHLNGPPVDAYVPMLRAAVQRHLEVRLDGETTSFHEFCNRLALEAVGRVLWGLSTDAESLDPLLERFSEFSEKVVRSPFAQLPKLQFDWGPFSPWGRLLRHEARMRRAFVERVELLRKRTGEPDSIVAHLIAAGLTSDEIVDELFTLLFGGHETTRSSMCWTVFHIVSNPAVQQRLVEEIDAQVGERAVAAADLDRLPYLWAVIHEALRISPIGPFSGGRIPRRDFELGGYRIRAGDPLVFCWHTMATRDEVWPEALKFDPDRFFARAGLACPNNFPFGRGRRICTGRGVALYETAVMLVTLFQQAEIELRLGKTAGDLHGRIGVGTPLGGLPVVLRPRRPDSAS